VIVDEIVHTLATPGHMFSSAEVYSALRCKMYNVLFVGLVCIGKSCIGVKDHGS